jgi:hypothetical protein
MSGNRTNYTVANETAITTRQLGPVGCAAGYSSFAGSVATVECPIAGGAFSFRGCTRSCVEPIAPLNGRVGSCGVELSHGSACTLTCNEGFTARGAQPHCLDGKLSVSLLCEANINCVGSWSTCLANCAPQIYTVTVPTSGDGSSCAALHGDVQDCLAGDGACEPADTSVIRVNIPGDVTLTGGADPDEISRAFEQQARDNLGSIRANVQVELTSFEQEVSAAVSLQGRVHDFSGTSSASLARRRQFIDGVALTLDVASDTVVIDSVTQTGLRRRTQAGSPSGLIDIAYSAVSTKDVSKLLAQDTFVSQLTNDINGAGNATISVSGVSTPQISTKAQYVITIMAESAGRNEAEASLDTIPGLTELVSATANSSSVAAQVSQLQIRTRGASSITGAVVNVTVPIVTSRNQVELFSPSPIDSGQPNEAAESGIDLLVPIAIGCIVTLTVAVAVLFYLRIRKARPKQVDGIDEDTDFDGISEGMVDLESTAGVDPALQLQQAKRLRDLLAQAVADQSSREERVQAEAAAAPDIDDSLQQAKRLRDLLAQAVADQSSREERVQAEAAAAPDIDDYLHKARRLKELLQRAVDAQSLPQCDTSVDAHGGSGNADTLPPAIQAAMYKKASRLRDLVRQATAAGDHHPQSSEELDSAQHNDRATAAAGRVHEPPQPRQLAPTAAASPRFSTPPRDGAHEADSPARFGSHESEAGEPAPDVAASRPYFKTPPRIRGEETVVSGPPLEEQLRKAKRLRDLMRQVSTDLGSPQIEAEHAPRPTTPSRLR